MLNIKTVIAAALLSSVAAVSFAQAPVAPKDEGATPPAAVTAPAVANTKTKPAVRKTTAKKHTVKKVKIASAAKKADAAAPAASAAK